MARSALWGAGCRRANTAEVGRDGPLFPPADPSGGVRSGGRSGGFRSGGGPDDVRPHARLGHVDRGRDRAAGNLGGGGKLPGDRVGVSLAARRCAAAGAPVRSAAAAVVARSPRRRPGRRPGRRGSVGRRGRGALRRHGGRASGGHGRARRRAADHLRTGTPPTGRRRPGHRRNADRHPARRAPRLPGGGVPALGPAPGRGVPGPPGPARPRSGPAAPARRLGGRRARRSGDRGRPGDQPWASSAESRTASRSYSSGLL
ncbi:hypothetical protein GA0070624_2299 [Micromonospora rhizosphaerae]|uniref:Uncharacterized protein n=1 Tax=Micromonospora rhizosphaerae TaxID=568872 RepID=A0A1C6RW22_9ACTN|nr:hypothetical protein GA0070624_2299 [Micromonospora rhizosphaerae]